MENINLIFMSGLVLFVAGIRKIFFFQRLPFPDPRKQELKDCPGERLEIMDVVRGAAILAVFFIHVSSFFYVNSQLTAQNGIFMLFMNNISRFAIALFFVTSGILLKPAKDYQKFSSFLKHKFFTIFLPYLLVAIFLEIFRHSSLTDALYNLALGRSSVPFYFIIILFQFYLLFPLLTKFISRKLLFLSFFISLFSQLFPPSWAIFGFPLFLKYLFFFVYGVYAREKFLSEKLNMAEKNRWLFLAAVYVFLSMILVGSYYNIRLVYGVAVFNLFMIYKDKLLSLGKLSRWLKSAGRLSLWLFLLHYPIMEAVFWKISVWHLDVYIKYFLVFFLTLFICAPLAFIIDRIYTFVNNSRKNAGQPG